MTRRSFTVKKLRHADLLRARYLARNLIKVELIVRPECLCDAEKHEVLEAYGADVQRQADEIAEEEAAVERWDAGHGGGEC